MGNDILFRVGIIALGCRADRERREAARDRGEWLRANKELVKGRGAALSIPTVLIWRAAQTNKSRRSGGNAGTLGH